ncbi:MAG: hypothetical protein ACRCSK_01315 [Fusobacteriaceae bacterium]
MLRCTYDNKLLNQGSVTDKLKEFKLCAPIIISGETELSDVSLKNRIIPVRLSKNNKAELEIYEKFKNTDILYKFGQEILSARLKKKVNITLQDTRIIAPKVKDDRQLYNCKCIVQGFLAMKNLINCTPELEQEFYSYLDDMFSNEYTPEKNFRALLSLVVESGEYLDNFYINDQRGHYSNFSTLYKAIVLEHERTNSTLELLDMATLKKQLRERDFIAVTGIKRFGIKIIASSCTHKF